MNTLINYESTDNFIDLFFKYPEMTTLAIYIAWIKILSLEKIKFFTYKILKGLESIH